ncbi:hypothetical protein SETIT_5G424800v2 [Setaria italica]|uniref:Protein kinase domain-containing protein n=1 Tax=Setaria italica TaxID=4555 RepID=A0A368REZ8_SETIT|nr:hypothetical protein SETIT_5G424800v2 [Setaria italica]
MVVVEVAAMVAAPPHSAAEKFTLRNLSRLTGDFAEEKKIGSGSFGSVYSAKLLDGREFAIKRAERGTGGGFCEEHGERILVFKFMPHDALQDHLHGGATNGSLLFASWEARLRVALDAARDVEYLHCYAVPAIIHRDVKPSNILLDDDWTVKVSDFGLSLASGGAVAVAVASSSVTAGTIGYIDPEYYPSGATCGLVRPLHGGVGSHAAGLRRRAADGHGEQLLCCTSQCGGGRGSTRSCGVVLDRALFCPFRPVAARLGLVDDAQRLFSATDALDGGLVTWNTMVSPRVQSGHFDEVVEVLYDMTWNTMICIQSYLKKFHI